MNASFIFRVLFVYCLNRDVVITLTWWMYSYISFSCLCTASSHILCTASSHIFFWIPSYMSDIVFGISCQCIICRSGIYNCSIKFKLFISRCDCAWWMHSPYFVVNALLHFVFIWFLPQSHINPICQTSYENNPWMHNMLAWNLQLGSIKLN